METCSDEDVLHETAKDVLSYHVAPPTPITALDDEDEPPPAKRPRLAYGPDEDKENERMEVVEDSKEARLEDAPASHEILRDLYEPYEAPLRPATPLQDSPYTCPSASAAAAASANNNNNISGSGCSSSMCNSSGGYSSSCSSSSSLSSYSDWSSSSSSRLHHQQAQQAPQQYAACGQASLLGNDLQSVVFHSLIASLES